MSPLSTDDARTGMQIIGRYRVLRRITTGGMAEIYLARHGEVSGFEKLVVIKRILPHLAEDPNFIKMFLDEAQIAALLDHPNVAQVFEVGRAGTEFFLAVELIQGETLSVLLNRAVERRQRISSRIVCLVLAHAAAGLHHAHTLKNTRGQPLRVVHRDVAPKNILVSFEGAVKLIDFGVARAVSRVSQTSAGLVKGTCAYMSPEQADGGDVDARSDVFALGVVLWETLVGRRLFVRENELATLRAIVDQAYPIPTRFVHVAPDLESIVMRALEKDRERRFASAQQMQMALEKHMITEGGASTLDIARLMHAMLPDRYQNWKKIIRDAHGETADPPDDQPGRLADDPAAGPLSSEAEAAKSALGTTTLQATGVAEALAAREVTLVKDAQGPRKDGQRPTQEAPVMLAPETVSTMALDPQTSADLLALMALRKGGQPLTPETAATMAMDPQASAELIAALNATPLPPAPQPGRIGSGTERMSVVRQPVAPAPGAEPPREPARRSRLLLVLGLGAVVGGVLGGAFFTLGPEGVVRWVPVLRPLLPAPAPGPPPPDPASGATTPAVVSADAATSAALVPTDASPTANVVTAVPADPIPAPDPSAEGTSATPPEVEQAPTPKGSQRKTSKKRRR